MIKFKLINDDQSVADYIADAISRPLSEGNRVLWLMAGGSAMDVAVKSAERLKEHANLPKLTVSLADERYGPLGHPDSNWRQLQERGFSLPGARMVPVLSDVNIDDTVANYKKSLDENLAESDYSLALAGMGADGHIFGIKPGSPAIGSDDKVVGYEWQDFIRVTPTAKFIKQLSEVIIYAIGAEKHQQLKDLDKDIDPSIQPAQLLKQLKNVTIYNDYKGERV